MKLICCLECSDVRKLRTGKVVACDCGKSEGAYEADGHHAWYSGPSVIIAIGNGSLLRALYGERHVSPPKPHTHRAHLGEVLAWVKPRECERLEYRVPHAPLVGGP